MNAALAALAALALSACVATRYEAPGGRKFWRCSLLGKLAMQRLTVTQNPDGTETISLEGYTNEQVATLAEIAEAAARGAASGALPFSFSHAKTTRNR